MPMSLASEMRGILSDPIYTDTGAKSQFVATVHKIEKAGCDCSYNELVGIIAMLDDAARRAYGLNKPAFRQAARRLRALSYAVRINQLFEGSETDDAFCAIDAIIKEYRCRHWTAKDSKIVIAALQNAKKKVENNPDLHRMLTRIIETLHIESGDYRLGKQALKDNPGIAFTDYLKAGGNPLALLDTIRSGEFIATTKSGSVAKSQFAVEQIKSVREYSQCLPFDVASATANTCLLALNVLAPSGAATIEAADAPSSPSYGPYGRKRRIR